jgi:5-methylthioadenosine/S-adenosylhomocysteine deaminase
VPVIIHVAETLTEVSEIKEKYGKTPVKYLDALGLLGPHLIADHCVHIEDADIKALAVHGVKVVHNPESNMKLASGIAPIPQMLSQGMTVGLGTDGCASNNNLDLFSEMDTAAKLHKVNAFDPTVMDALSVLKMATIHGARVLGLDHVTGSLEVGKKADVIVINTHTPHLTPMYNPTSHIVYAARGNDVRHSIINGQLVMEDRKLLTLDIADVIAQARETSVRVKSWLSSERFT